MSAIAIFQQLSDHAQSNQLSDELYAPVLKKEGDYSYQGDIVIWYLPKLPEGVIQVFTVAQLAPGTTRGSRHCIRQSDLPKVEQFQLKNPNPLQGPILKLSAPIVIEHPEHKHQQISAQFVAITYQRKHSDELRRVAD